MKRKDVVLGSIVSAALLFAGLGYAQGPGEKVDPRRHPNLAEAQRFCWQAIDKISVAQHANEFDMGGHAARAKELLEQASAEIKEAAIDANRHH